MSIIYLRFAEIISFSYSGKSGVTGLIILMLVFLSAPDKYPDAFETLISYICLINKRRFLEKLINL